VTIIIEDSSQLQFDSDLHKILEPILPEIEELNWLCNNVGIIAAESYLSKDIPALKKLLSINFDCAMSCTISGTEFVQLLGEEGIQYVWAVFSGFLSTPPVLELKDFPYADCNEKIWTDPSVFQHPESLIEIICFDSSCTILKLQNDQLAKLVLSKFPEGRILESNVR
jgi:hypothetical protein